MARFAKRTFRIVRSPITHCPLQLNQPHRVFLSVIYNWFRAPLPFVSDHSFVLLPRCGVFDTTGYLRFFDSWILGNKFRQFQKYPPLVETIKYICDTRRLSECSPFVEIIRRRVREMKTRDIFFSSIIIPRFISSLHRNSIVRNSL